MTQVLADQAISLRGLRKEFGSVVAVNGVDLDVRDGEFLTLLGPSGSGKTTVLRMIAGFEEPTAGTITLGGVDVTHRPPYLRDVNTVFQDYALFPHLTVQGNVEYGLRVKGVSRSERRTRASAALESVQLGGYGERKPAELSGGQRQRVALARALVNQPRVLLLDEPLGALDMKLREQMQIELKELQRRVGITFVFVTHDQDEALALSDRIVVFNQGRIEQIGTPMDIYEHPATEFVAGFVGTSNLLRGEAARKVLGRDGVWSIRPEKIRVGDPAMPSPEGMRIAAGVVREVVYLGQQTRATVELDAGGTLVAVAQNSSGDSGIPQRGTTVRLEWNPEFEYSVGMQA